MPELREAALLAAGTMHVWTTPAVMIFWGVLYVALDLFMFAIGER